MRCENFFGVGGAGFLFVFWVWFFGLRLFRVLFLCFWRVVLCCLA